MRKVLFAMVIALCAGPLHAEVVAIRAGALFDAASERLQNDVTIVVQDGRIAAVGRDVAVPDGARLVDLSGHTVLPGLIDLHTHLMGSPAGLAEHPGTFLFRYPERAVLLGSVHARRTLMAGFTTVRDVGAPATSALALRDAINEGMLPGPRIIVGIGIGTTGSHCDPTTGLKPGTGDFDAFRGYVFDGADEARAAVRRAVRDGADMIKICATAGVLSLSDEIGPAQMTPAELEAVVETANMLDRRVAAHAHGIEGIRNAVRAGVHTIDHASVLDAAVLREMRERGTFVVPTMMAFTSVMAMADAGRLPPGPTRKALDIRPLVRDSHRLAFRSNVNIAFGTDAGVAEHGDNAQEFALMVEAGLPPARALLSATRVAADALGRLEDLGTIEVGKRADIIAVPGNPLDDISVMERVDFVMKDGRVYLD